MRDSIERQAKRLRLRDESLNNGGGHIIFAGKEEVTGFKKLLKRNPNILNELIKSDSKRII